MTKQEMISEIIKESGLTQRANSRQMEVAYNRFLAKPKEFVLRAYNMVTEGQCSGTYAVAVASGILFAEK